MFQTVELPSHFSDLSGREKFQAYRDLWDAAAHYEILTSFPLHLDIELSGVCNLRCESCFQSGLIHSPLGLMDFDLYRRIIDKGIHKGLCAVKLQIRGESFLHPRLFDCIAYAKDAGVSDVQITTNGTLLNERNIERILSSRLDAIIFSVDNHHGTSYKRKENHQCYSEVEQKIKNLLAARKQMNKIRPWIRLRSSIPDTDHEAVFQTKQYLKSRFPEADIYVVGRIHDFRDDRDAYPDLKTNYELQPCSHLMQRLAIFWNGDITTCCMDYNNRFQLGNLQFCTIEEVWMSVKMNRFRDWHLNHKRGTMPVCRHCHVCTIAKSTAVAQDDTPRHIADYRRQSIFEPTDPAAGLTRQQPTDDRPATKLQC